MGEYKKLWTYNPHDMTTWKYLDFVMTGTLKSRTAHAKFWILNPEFKFAHLDKVPRKGNEIAFKK